MTNLKPGTPYETSGQSEPLFVLQERYEVTSQLGQGGMGTVYVARDLRLAGRQCVVKKLRDDYFREEDRAKAISFFKREADVLARLAHPNIVQISDNFNEDDECYLVMEYVEGENLHDMLLKRGEPFDEDQVLSWAAQIAEVLHYMHTHEPPVIYRDLKPSNIMIDTKGHVKLVDFGIARPYAEDSDNTHVVSAGYSPPEQYWGAADTRSDIYALGATMYFLLTGQEPLALQTSSPAKVNEQISEHSDLIVQRATAQDVWLRYQSATEMKEDLEWKKDQQYRKSPISATAALIAVLSCVVIVGFCLALVTISNSHNQARESKLNSKYQELVQQLSKKERELERLKLIKEQQQAAAHRGQSSQPLSYENDPAITTPRPAGLSISQPPPMPRPAPRQRTAPSVAFREQDEIQLTDPEGLTPLEEDTNQRPGFQPPFSSNSNNSGSEQPQ